MITDTFKNTNFACSQLRRTPETEAAADLALLVMLAKTGTTVPSIQLAMLTSGIVTALAKGFNMPPTSFAKLVKDADGVLSDAFSKDIKDLRNFSRPQSNGRMLRLICMIWALCVRFVYLPKKD